MKNCLSHDRQIALLQVGAYPVLRKEAWPLGVLHAGVKITITTDEPRLVCVSGRMCEPNPDARMSAVWTLEVFKMAFISLLQQVSLQRSPTGHSGGCGIFRAACSSRGRSCTTERSLPVVIGVGFCNSSATAAIGLRVVSSSSRISNSLICCRCGR